MARHARRLILWIGGIALALALLVVLAVVALAWLVDPNAWRARIARSASEALGREVQLDGDLHWNIGWNIAIAEEGGSIANAAGFPATPFARWQRMRFGLNARALLGKRIVIDQLAIDGLQVHLQRNAAGEGNWTFTSKQAETNPNAAANGGKPIALQVAAVQLRESQLSFSSAQGAWKVGDLSLDVKLPPDLGAPSRELRDVALRGRLSGGPLPAAGVAISFESASLQQDATAASLAVPAFKAGWNEAQLTGSINAAYGEPLTAQGKLALRVPSVRTQLEHLKIALPPMADPRTLGRLDVDGSFDIKGPTLAVTDLHVVLDDTTLDGTVSVPQFSPLAMRFDLTGDSIDFDRYLEPAGYKGKPFELPLAQLKALHMQGVLRMKSATVKGAKATELRIDVE
jgi:AsmA protein